MQNSNKRPQPVLMIPLRRCGSHALRLRLNFSDDFYSPYPLHISDFMHLNSLYGDLSNDQHYFQLVIDVIGLQSATMVKWDKVTLNPITVFEAIKKSPRSIHAILWEMQLQAGEQYNAKVIMDKSVDNIIYAEKLLEIQPNLLFINVVRDPRAQVNSMNKSIIYDFDTLANTLRWVKAHDMAQQLIKKYPQKFLTIRFEDFINNQEAILRKICDFIKIDFSETMLEIGNSEEACAISHLSALWQTNMYNPIASNIDKFKQKLSLKEIGLIESLAVEYMNFYGYKKMTSAQTQITDNDIQATSLHSEIKKQEAWEQLKQNDFQDYLLRQFRNEYICNIEARLRKRA